MQWVTKNVEETYAAARSFVEELTKLKPNEALVVGLHGDLGSGKTTFVQGVARALGVAEHITSPTFVILKKYQTPDTKCETLVHVDAYRLISGEDLLPLGWEDIIRRPESLVLVEWPEIVEDVLPAETPILNFEHTNETTRRITLIQRTS